jgi:Tfp pilus assembly protein PilN
MQSANFIVSANGFAAMSRNIPIGIEQLVVDADASRQFADELRASLDAYEQDGLGKRPSRVVLTKKHPGLVGLEAVISDALGITLSVAPYVDHVTGSKAVKNALLLDFADEAALDIIASGVMAAKCQADLVPQEVKDQRLVSEKGKEALKAGLFVLLSLLFIGGALLSKVYFKDQFLKQNLIASFANERAEVGNLENMAAKTRALKEYLEGRNLPLDVIRELYRLIPPEIYLSNISMDGAESLSIQGVSESMSKVFAFVSSLEESPLFDAVKTKSTATKKDRGKDVAVFEIVMKVVQQDAVASETRKEDKK